MIALPACRSVSRVLPRQSGFVRTLDAMETGAKLFGKPVLLDHGDEHFFR